MDPTIEQIASITRAIREAWSDDVELARRSNPRLPECQTLYIRMRRMGREPGVSEYRENGGLPLQGNDADYQAVSDPFYDQ